MKALRIALIVLASVVAVAFATGAWLLYTQTGSRLLLEAAARMLDGRLAIGATQGTLGRGLELRALSWRDGGLVVAIDSAQLAFAPLQLLRGRLHVYELTMRGLTVDLPQAAPAASAPRREPASTPIDLVLERVAVEGATLREAGRPLLQLEQVQLAAAWSESLVAVESLSFSSGAVRATLDGRANLNDPARTRGRAQLRFSRGSLDLAANVQARSENGRWILDGVLTSPAPARFIASLAPGPGWRWQARIDVPSLEPARLDERLKNLGSLAGTLEGSGDLASAAMHGSVVIDGERFDLRRAEGRFDAREVHVAALELHAPGGGSFTGSGTLWLESEPRADMSLQWHALPVPQRLAGQPLTLTGALTLAGTLSRLRTTGRTSVASRHGLSQVGWQLQGNRRALEVEELVLKGPRTGELTASGRVTLEPHPSWYVRARAHRFDPSIVWAKWPGSLGFRLASEGELRAGRVPRLDVELRELQGQLRGHPVSGDGRLQVLSASRATGSLQLSSGGSTLRVEAVPGTAMDLTATASVAALGEWLPGAGGRAGASLRARGHWPALHVEGSLQGGQLQLQELRAESATIDLDVRNPLQPEGDVQVVLRDAAIAGFRFETAQLRASGNLPRHTVTLHAAGRPVGADLSLSASLAGGSWDAALEQLALEVQGAPRLQLQPPARIVLGERGNSLSQTCLRGEGIGLCLAGERAPDGRMGLRYSVEDLPLALLARLALPERPLDLAGTLGGRGDLDRAADGTLSGRAELASSRGALTQGPANAPLVARYENLLLSAQLQGSAAHARMQADFPGQGNLAATLELTDVRSADPQLQGSGRLALRDLSPVSLLVPQLAKLRGGGEISAEAEGTLDAPRFSAAVRLADLEAELPALGLALQRGRLDAQRTPQGAIQVSGAVSSGTGTLELRSSGGSGNDEALRVEASGHDFLIANVPGAHISASPDLQLTRTAAELALTGKVTIPSAAIDLDKLQHGGGRAPSQDVVVTDRPARKPVTQRAIRTDVTFVFGPDVKLVGWGLDAKLQGELRVTEPAGGDSIASGELRLAGTFDAYGRKLTIERGRLLFAGTSLSDPQLDIVAVRKLPDVTAMLLVTGTALHPRLNVTADEPMSSTEAMSYLITGKAVDDLRGDESAAMDQAVQSLGGVLGERLGKQFAGRLGVDSVDVEQSADLGGSALTFGKYLSPRFFVSYGVGIFQPGHVVTMRYEITDHLSLEANESPENQHAGIDYRIEK